MNKKKPYLQASDYNKERFSTSRKIKFDWNIIYKCNFRCPYCFFEGKWEEYSKRNVILPSQRWGQLWKRIYDMYDSASIVVTGGEPFVYPDFINIIKDISRFHYPINISSNGSGDLKKLVAETEPGKVSVTLSFHPEFNNLTDIILKHKFLTENGFGSEYINLCVYPPYLKKINKWMNIVDREDVNLKIIPFIGRYNKKSYPDGYTMQEKKLLGMDTEWEQNVKRRGTLCAAGMKSSLIFPDGKVARCGQIGERHLIGDFFSDNFRLLDNPLPCDAELCPCLETVSPDIENE